MLSASFVSADHSLTNSEISRYSRQLILPQIGVEGQEALKSARVLVIGAGGLGCPAAIYLTAAGVGNIGIVDHDKIELSNLHRQILHSENNIGKSKAVSVVEQCKRLNSQVQFQVFDTHFNTSNASEIVSKFDIVLDATDNVVTRYLINDVCVLAQKPLVSGAALGFEGQLTVYNFNNGPCYRCLYPEPPPPETITSCSEGGILGVVPGIIGSLQALTTIKIILNLELASAKKLLLFDALSFQFRSVKLRDKQAGCDVCGSTPAIRSLSDCNYEYFCGTKAHDKVLQQNLVQMAQRVTPQQLHSALNSPHLLVDVRPEVEFGISRLNNSLNIPLSNLAAPDGKHSLEDHVRSCALRGDGLSGQQDPLPVFVICRRGNDSQRAVQILQEQLKDCSCVVKDVVGGLTAWAAEVDPTFPIY